MSLLIYYLHFHVPTRAGLHNLVCRIRSGYCAPLQYWCHFGKYGSALMPMLHVLNSSTDLHVYVLRLHALCKYCWRTSHKQKLPFETEGIRT